MVDQGEHRNDEDAKRELELARETLIKFQALQIQASDTKCRKQRALIRALYAELITTAIPELRKRPFLSERDYYSQETERTHFMEVAILPRIRRRLIEMTQALDPTRLQEALFPEDRAMQVSWIGLVKDISKLNWSVEVPHLGVTPERLGSTTSRPPLFTEDAQNVKIAVEKCHFPQLRQRVDEIADGTITLFEQYLATLEAQESQPIDTTFGSSLRKLLKSIDGIIWDLQHPGEVVRAKWQQLAEKIELMELTVVRFMKAKELQQDLEVETVDYEVRWMTETSLIKAGIKQLQDYYTLLKVYRVLAHKISDPTTSEPLFPMSQLGVNDLCKLFFKIEIVDRKLNDMASDVSDVYERRNVKDFAPIYQTFKNLPWIFFYNCNAAGDWKELINGSGKWCYMWHDLHKAAFKNFSDTHIVTGTP